MVEQAAEESSDQINPQLIQQYKALEENDVEKYVNLRGNMSETNYGIPFTDFQS